MSEWMNEYKLRLRQPVNTTIFYFVDTRRRFEDNIKQIRKNSRAVW